MNKINESNLHALFELLPEEYRRASVKSVIKKALKSHLVDYVREMILYSNAYSDDPRWQAYRFYLGESIEKGWGKGFIDYAHGKNTDVFLHSRRQVSISMLIHDSRRGCKISQQVLTERGIPWIR